MTRNNLKYGNLIFVLLAGLLGGWQYGMGHWIVALAALVCGLFNAAVVAAWLYEPRRLEKQWTP